MGKGIIKSGGDDGLYNVELVLHRERIDVIIAIIDAQIAVLTIKINAMEEGDAKELEKLRRASYQKRKDYINNNLPEDPAVSAWCGDLTEDLSGNVGTIEIPGERGVVQIQPGYEGGAAYDTTRDGQLQPAIADTPAGTFYNLAMLPGWQKWMPTYRHGIISNIDTDNDTCNVTLYADKSSQQGLSINQESNLSGIPIEYMSCNSSAFEDGDAVLVKFEGQEWSGAKVVGFKDNPKECAWEQWGETLCANHQWQFWGFTEFYLCPALPFTDSDEAGSVLSIDIVAGILDYKLDLTESDDSYGYSTVYWNLEGEPTANIKVGTMKIKVKATSEGSAEENNYTHIWIQTTSPHKSVFFTLSATNPSGFPCFIGDNDGEKMEIDLTDYGFTLDAAITYIGLGIRSTLGRKGQLEMDYISF